jgi:archaellum component FlaC
MLCDMSDCFITRYDFREATDPRTMESKRVLYHLPVEQKAESALTSRKYLVLSELIREFRRLRRVLASGDPFPDPEEAFKSNRSRRHRIDMRLVAQDQALSEREQEYAEADVQEPRRQRQIRERSERIIADAKTAVADLQDQLADCAEQLEQLHRDGADLERVVTLQKQRATILNEIESRRTEIEAQEVTARRASQRIEQCRATAAELAEEIRSLKDYREELEHRRAELTRLMDLAAAQEDIQSLTIRVHKRLSQAASVFTFALLGIPLGILCGRRSVMIAFGISFGVVLMVFYPFLIAGTVAAESGSLPIAPAIWAGNAIVAVFGGILTVRVLGH